MKRILLILIVLVMAAIVAASFAVRQAPTWLRTALESALGKSVQIREIDFQFPTTFVLSGVMIAEKDGPFAGEPEFAAESVRLTAVPTGLRSRQIAIDEIEVRDASVTVRKSGGRLYHVFLKRAAPGTAVAAPASAAPSVERTVSVGLLRLIDARFQWADFDIGERGFVFDAQGLSAKVSGISVPASERKMSYALQGRLLQGRDQKPAEFDVKGSTSPQTLDTDARVELKGAHLPYFAPYLARVTAAQIQEGYLDVQSNVRVRSGEVAAEAELAFTSLFFGSLEGGSQLFGLSAQEILDFLKDSSGRLRIPVSVRWNFRDRDQRLRDAVRRSVEASLKRTVFGNMGALLEKAIVGLGEKGFEAPQETTESVLKKIKDFLKY